MEPAAYLEHLETDARALLAASWSDPMLTVPTCPDWTLSDLAGHLARAFHWVDEMVRTQTAEIIALPALPEDWEEISAWYEAGMTALLETLGRTDPGAPVWNWVVMGPAPARFWHRRMAHEASIHRWDAASAVREPEPIGADLASDGIDEYLTIAARWLEISPPHPDLKGALGLETTDGDFVATALLAPDSLTRRSGTDGADCIVRAGSSDLLLWLVGRKALLDDGIEATGDVTVAARWAEVSFG